MALKARMTLLTGETGKKRIRASPEAPSRALRSRGFTLLETMLVVIILAVLAGAAIPNFSQTYRQLRLKKTAEDLANLMRYAQGRAVTKGIPLRLEFDSAGRMCGLTQAEPAGEDEIVEAADQHNFQRIAGGMGRKRKTPDGLRIVAEKPQIYFYPDGRIDKAFIYVCRTENSSACHTISTREQRGYVKIFDYELPSPVFAE